LNPHPIATAAAGLLLAASFAPRATAQTPSSVQIYGSITTAVIQKSNQIGGTSLNEVGNSLLSASYFVLRGQEDLGGGLAASFRLESALGTDTGSAGSTVGGTPRFWSRQSFVGLNLGQVASLTLGRQFHAATDRVIRTLDVNNVAGTSLHTTPLALFGVNRFAGNDGRADDSAKLRVNGPLGLQGGLSIGADDGAGRSTTVDLAQVTDRYSVAAWVAEFNSPNVIAATGKRPRHALWGVGGNLRVGPVRLYLHLLDSHLDATVANRPNQKNRLLHLGANWQAADLVTVRAAWYQDDGKALNGVVGRDGGKDTLVLSGEYGLSKRTSLHLAVASNRFDGGYRLEPGNLAGLGRDPNASSTRAVTAGVRHDF
jgi:predicted porin